MYILEVPDVEELIIPEYIDGKKVIELGHRDEGVGYAHDYFIASPYTKKLIIQHQFDFRDEKVPSFDYYHYVNFPNLTKLVFMDYLYCHASSSQEEITVLNYWGENNYSKETIVELRKSNREFSLEDFKPKVIIIPEYVELIEAGVFAGLTDVTIKTSYESKPDGWEDGWNGTCEVEWGTSR